MLLSERFISSWRAPALIAAIAALAALVGVFTLPVLDRDEARFAQATAQMLETGDYVRIWFQDTPRHKKPIGIHWLQAVSVAATTGEDARAIWAYRLPSVLGAVLAALSAFWAGARLYDRRTGLAAGALLGASVLLGAEGGIAKTDALLVGLTGLSLLCLIELRLAEKTRTARIWAVALWAAVAAGALVKGPVTPMIAGLAVLTLCAVERRISWLKLFAFWPGPLLAAAIVLPWLVGVQIATDGAFLREALGQDLAPKMTSGHEGHGAPFGSHLALLSLLSFPAILFLPAGVQAALADLRGVAQARRAPLILLSFAVPGWLVFELLPTKLPHYVLPLYPALAVLAGLGWTRWGQAPRLWRWLGTGLFAVSALLAGGGLAGLAVAFDGPRTLAAGAALLVVGLAAMAGLAALRNRMGAALIAAVLAGLSWHAAGRGVIAPHLTVLFPAEAVQARLAPLQARWPDAPLVSTYTEPSLVFRLGGAVQLTDAETLAAAPLDFSQPRLYLIDLSRWPETDRDTLVRLRAAACHADRAEGLNYSRGDPVTIEILVTGCSEADRSTP